MFRDNWGTGERRKENPEGLGAMLQHELRLAQRAVAPANGTRPNREPIIKDISQEARTGVPGETLDTGVTGVTEVCILKGFEIDVNV